MSTLAFPPYSEMPRFFLSFFDMHLNILFSFLYHAWIRFLSRSRSSRLKASLVLVITNWFLHFRSRSASDFLILFASSWVCNGRGFDSRGDTFMSHTFCLLAGWRIALLSSDSESELCKIAQSEFGPDIVLQKLGP